MNTAIMCITFSVIGAIAGMLLIGIAFIHNENKNKRRLLKEDEHTIIDRVRN